MAGEWRTATVTELQRDGILLVEDGNHGEYRPRPDEFVESGVAFIRAADMDGGRVLFHSAAKINEHARQRITKGIGAPGDVLLSHKGTVGKVALVPNGAPTFVCSPQTTFWRTRDEQRLDRKYLYAFLRSPEFHAQLATRAGETDMAPYVSLTSQRGLSVTLPPLGEQRAIAHILGTLDDKIELNRRMNETLEAMARALFKSWFVDFDPVRAKAEGRDPGLPKPLADLFPARLVASELGEIPERWEVKVLDNLSGVVLGGDWGVDEPSPDHTERARCIRGADIPDLQVGGMGKMPVRYLKPSSLGKRGLSDGDLVVEISGGSPSQSTGRPVLVSARLLHRLDASLVCSNFCRLLKPKKRVYSKFLYLWLRALYSADEFLQFENGTTGIKNLAFTLFSSRYKLCMPPDGMLEKFEAQVAPAFARQQSTAAEADSLSALRDTLLPKLISGEVRIKDVGGLLKEAPA